MELQMPSCNKLVSCWRRGVECQRTIKDYYRANLCILLVIGVSLGHYIIMSSFNLLTITFYT